MKIGGDEIINRERENNKNKIIYRKLSLSLFTIPTIKERERMHTISFLIINSTCRELINETFN
jgi:hypothetical protein